MSLTIRKGEMFSLTGASGSGKSTLLKTLGCLDRPSSGRNWLDGVDVSRLTPAQRACVRGSKLGFVFQSFQLLSRTSALDNVLLPLENAATRVSRVEATRYARLLLERVMGRTR